MQIVCQQFHNIDLLCKGYANVCMNSIHKLETVRKLSSFPNSCQMWNSRYTTLETVCSCTCTNQFPMWALELFLLCNHEHIATLLKLTFMQLVVIPAHCYCKNLPRAWDGFETKGFVYCWGSYIFLTRVAYTFSITLQHTSFMSCIISQSLVSLFRDVHISWSFYVAS